MQVAEMTQPTLKFWIIRNRDSVQISEYRVVLTNTDNRLDCANRFPYPIVISVDINAENPNLS